MHTAAAAPAPPMDSIDPSKIEILDPSEEPAWLRAYDAPTPNPGQTEQIAAACDPAGGLLFDPSTQPMKSIRDAYMKKEFWDALRRPISPLIVIVFSIPWLWYFLLARVQELSDSIRGKPD